MYVRQDWSLETMRSVLCLSSCIIYILRSTGHIIDLPTPTSLTYKHVYLAVYMRTHHRPSLCLWKANYKNYNFFLV